MGTTKIEPHLESEDIPEFRLSEDGDRSPKCGWNTWLLSGRDDQDMDTLPRGGPDNLFVWVPEAQEVFRHAMYFKGMPTGRPSK